jgi:predicted Zn finger-like uncharacterized protein
MIITCENCKTRFNLDESLLDANGSTVRCSRCRHMFTTFPPPPEPEFDSLDLDDSDFDQNFELDASDYDDAEDLTEDRSQEKFDAEETVDFEELELETIDSDEIEIEIEDTDTVSAEEPDPDLSVETDMSGELELAEEPTDVSEELALDETLSEDQEPDFDLAFDLDEKTPETEDLDLEIPEDKESDIFDPKTSSPPMEDTNSLKKTAKDDMDEDKTDDFDHDDQRFDGLDDFDTPNFDKTDMGDTDTSDTSSHEPPPPRRPARASLIQPLGRENEWMAKEDTPPPKKSLIGLPVLLLLMVFLLAAGGYIAATFMGYKIPFLPEIRIPFIQQYLPGKTAEPVSFPEPVPDQKSVTGRFMTNDAAGELFIITGKIENPAQISYQRIQVKGTLFQKEKKPAMSQVAFCGNIIPEDTLKTAPVKDLASQLETPTEINDKLLPGATIPFMLVFSDLPGNLENFTVEVVGFDRTTP